MSQQDLKHKSSDFNLKPDLKDNRHDSHIGSSDRSVGRVLAFAKFTVERRYSGRGEEINLRAGSPSEITNIWSESRETELHTVGCYATQYK